MNLAAAPLFLRAYFSAMGVRESGGDWEWGEEVDDVNHHFLLHTITILFSISISKGKPLPLIPTGVRPFPYPDICNQGH